MDDDYNFEYNFDEALELINDFYDLQIKELKLTGGNLKPFIDFDYQGKGQDQ